MKGGLWGGEEQVVGLISLEVFGDTLRDYQRCQRTRKEFIFRADAFVVALGRTLPFSIERHSRVTRKFE